MLYPVIINKFQRAPQNEFDFGRKSQVAGPRQCQEQRQTQANKPKTKQKTKNKSKNKMKRQRVENNKLTSHGRRCYRTLDPGRGGVKIGGDCREWQHFFASLLQV